MLGVFLAVDAAVRSALPAGAARPWLFAVALAPVAMVMPWLMSRTERWLDRMWLGREFTPVEAVKHVLAAMQPATDEAQLIAAAEARLSEIFGTTCIVVLRRAGRRARAVIEHDVIAHESGVGRAAADRRASPGRACGASSAKTWRCCDRSPACSASCSRTSGCSSRRQEQDQLAQELRLQIEQVGAEGAARADQSALPLQCPERDRVADSHRSGPRRRSRRAARGSVPLHAAPIGLRMGAARSGAGVRARLSRRRAGAVRPAADLHDRFGSRVAGAAQIPSMLLQTLLENAVKHGVSQARGPGRIEVIVRTTTDQ